MIRSGFFTAWRKRLGSELLNLAMYKCRTIIDKVDGHSIIYSILQ